MADDANTPSTQHDTITGYSPVQQAVGFTVAGIGGILGVVHGWGRHKTVGGAFAWGLFGVLLPPIAVPIAILEGFAQPSTRLQLKTISEQIAELEAKGAAQSPVVVNVPPGQMPFARPAWGG